MGFNQAALKTQPPPARQQVRPPPEREEWAAGAALILLAGVLAYLPTLRNGFVWDDDTFLVHNALVQASDGWIRLWTSAHQPDYWPVTLSTFWVEWRLWGRNALGYHLTNLALHLVAAVLLWRVLRRLRVPGALLGTLLFAVHPVNVESVAWIAQRKGLVAMVFFLLSIRFFLQSAWLGSAEGRGILKDRRYWLSLAAFALAMLSKGSVALLPLVLLGILAWRRRLQIKDILRLAPFFAVAGALVLVNVWFENRGFADAIRHPSHLQRLLGAGAVVWFYLYKALLPLKLVFVYPQWKIDPANPMWWIPLLAAAGVTALLARKAAASTRWRGALFAWGYFGLMLVPVMGLTDVYYMRYSLVADHYQYLALIGVTASAGAAWSGWAADRRAKSALAAAVVAALGLLTWRQSLTYRDAETLYLTTLRKNPRCWMVYNSLGLLRRASGRAAEARECFRRAIELNPDYAEAHLNLGVVELGTGDAAGARREFEKAAALDPRSARAHLNLGVVELYQGRAREAVGQLQEATRLEPDYAEAYYNLGNALQGLGRDAEAAAAFTEALRLRPGDSDAEDYLGTVYVDLGRMDDALVHFQRSIAANPGNAEAYCNLGSALERLGRPAEAASQYARALRARPGYPAAVRALARLQAAAR